jgi:hypothetical protein
MRQKLLFTLLVWLSLTGSLWAQTATAPIVGDGSSTNPYQIATADNLYWISQTSSAWTQSYYFKQTTDIDLSSVADWTPIGNQSIRFIGSYDGGGHKITGLKVNNALNAAGLFGVIYDGIIKNLRIESANVSSSLVSSFAGILVGQFARSASISNCTTSGTVHGAVAGGLIGYMSAGSITGCYSMAVVESPTNGTNPTAGGFIGVIGGSSYSVSISDCYATGNVTNTSSTKIGGFVGSCLSSNASVSNCYSSGKVTGSNPGGFLGYYTNGNFSNCFFDSETAGTSNVVVSSGVTSKTTAEMKASTNFSSAGWSTATWSLTDGNYPKLLWTLPTLSTQNVSNIGLTSATGNGNITGLGVSNLTAYGVCWNTTANPTTLDSKVDLGSKSTTGIFTTNITSLKANTTYHLRAYATNNLGTTYGNDVTFTTLMPLTVTITKTDDTQTTATNATSLQAAIGTIALGDVKKLEISGGNFTSENWSWLQNNRSNLVNLTHFTITDGVDAVANIPDTYPTSTYFGSQLQELKVAKMVDVGDYSFLGCTSLTTIDLPQVTRIKTEVFRNCTSLTNVNLPQLNQVYAGAFKGCTSLTSISLPLVFSIQGSAFDGCTALTNLMLRAAPPTSYTNAFTNCPTARYLVIADANGQRLTGTALDNARAAYKTVDDGNTTDDLWYGWKTNRNLYVPSIDGALVNGNLTAGNTSALLFDGYAAGTTLTITATPAAGNKLTPGSLRVYKTGDESTTVTLTGNSFTMPDFEVTVTCVFEPLPLQISFVSANSCNFTIGIATAENTTIYVDKGDGVKVGYEVTTDGAPVPIAAYTAGSTVKIYGENITGFSLLSLGITTLDVSNAAALTSIYCQSNQLTFQTLPQQKTSYTSYVYAPQNDMAATCTNGVVDLSSQFTATDVNGVSQTTVYTWYLADGTALTTGTDYIGNNGVFKFIKMPTSYVYCTMTNAAFPNLTLNTTNITVDAVATSTGINANDIHTQSTKAYSVRKIIYVTGLLSNSVAKLYDINGRSINMYKITTEGSVTLDESSLLNGVYVLQIISSGKTDSFKLRLNN